MRLVWLRLPAPRLWQTGGLHNPFGPGVYPAITGWHLISQHLPTTHPQKKVLYGELIRHFMTPSYLRDVLAFSCRPDRSKSLKNSAASSAPPSERTGRRKKKLSGRRSALASTNKSR